MKYAHPRESKNFENIRNFFQDESADVLLYFLGNQCGARYKPDKTILIVPLGRMGINSLAWTVTWWIDSPLGRLQLS